MDPCPFVRILVGNLALKLPRSPSAACESSSSNCLAKVRFKGFPTQVATIPIVQEHDDNHQNSQHHRPRHSSLQSSSSSASSSNPNPNSSSSTHSLAACFNLDKSQIDKFLQSKKPKSLNIEIYAGDDGGGPSSSAAACCCSSRKLMGTVVVPLDLRKAEFRPSVMHNGWVPIGGRKKGDEPAHFFLNVRVEPEPRYVFQFESDPVCSPQIFQVQGSVKQAVFTCKFNLRNQGDRSSLSRPDSSAPTGCLRSITGGGDGGSQSNQFTKDRKGWTITIHDLSGSPVAMASMVTPFVPSPGSDRVSRSNPGAWLILRPSSGTWKSWGRLEAWREGRKGLGYRFDLLHDGITATPTTSTLVNSVVSTKGRGKFAIDMTGTAATPACSPHSSCDFGSGSGSWSGSEFGLGMLSQPIYKGFVMSSTVEGKGGQPEVEIGIQHVNCTEDAAVFVALAAAVDLSKEACRSFPRRLRKGLQQQA
ncbi:unnamed protein product [Linum tenue]|uniref:Formin-like protein 18 n=1 Tax=Linum tenue TaxID=586396 RepID=A0AAV0IU92_9ROSI|nr:unnamed protein product [Linum tenue]